MVPNCCIGMSGERNTTSERFFLKREKKLLRQILLLFLWTRRMLFCVPAGELFLRMFTKLTSRSSTRSWMDLKNSDLLLSFLRPTDATFLTLRQSDRGVLTRFLPFLPPTKILLGKYLSCILSRNTCTQSILFLFIYRKTDTASREPIQKQEK